MNLIINSILTLTLIIDIITNIKKIKSNKEVVKVSNKVYLDQEEVKKLLEERNKIIKEQNKEVINVKEHFKDIKENLSIDYEHITEEVLKRIYENSKSQKIVLPIDGEEVRINSLENLAKRLAEKINANNAY